MQKKVDLILYKNQIKSCLQLLLLKASVVVDYLLLLLFILLLIFMLQNFIYAFTIQFHLQFIKDQHKNISNFFFFFLFFFLFYFSFLLLLYLSRIFILNSRLEQNRKAGQQTMEIEFNARLFFFFFLQTAVRATITTATTATTATWPCLHKRQKKSFLGYFFILSFFLFCSLFNIVQQRGHRSFSYHYQHQPLRRLCVPYSFD